MVTGGQRKPPENNGYRWAVKPPMELRLRTVNGTPRDRRLKAKVGTNMVTEVHLSKVLCNEWVRMKDYQQKI